MEWIEKGDGVIRSEDPPPVNVVKSIHERLDSIVKVYKPIPKWDNCIKEEENEEVDMDIL